MHLISQFTLLMLWGWACPEPLPQGAPSSILLAGLWEAAKGQSASAMQTLDLLGTAGTSGSASWILLMDYALEDQPTQCSSSVHRKGTG